MSITKFSPNFIELCLRTDLKQGDKLPCPRCGKEETIYKDPRSHKVAGAIAVVASGLLWLLTRTSAVGPISMLFAGLFFLVTLTLEPAYACSHCQFQWRVKDALKWAKAIRHDEEARSRRRQG